MALFVVLTAFKDSLLQRELEGYGAYAERVRHRLMPGVWSRGGDRAASSDRDPRYGVRARPETLCN